MDDTDLPQDHMESKPFLTDFEKEIVKKAHKRGIIIVNEPITSSSVYTVYQKLDDMINERRKLLKPKPIQVVLNSPGGDAFVGLTIAKMLAASKVPITTKVVGMAASAAGLIFLGGHKRVVLPGSRLMLHDSWGISFGATGEHTRRIADMHEGLDNEIVEFISERTGLDKKLVEKECSKDHWYIGHEQALKMGFSTK